MHVTEASCDACPAKCRLEMFTAGRRTWDIGTGDNRLRCVRDGERKNWIGADAVPTAAPEIRKATGFMAAGTTSRWLLACNGCPAPCILETEAGVLPTRCPANLSAEKNRGFGWFFTT